ncbi:hypothetical protein [Corynebacterium parakroppenstedtii]|uniref:hypothetical protein n=1 Tax=Corynebacterium parakroppenstedtii TaxID=2828363 RepID=UPI001C8D3663|nr:hypothetical protein [Corynebacterium parakroppenstedtii]MBY0796728.1 hypothetical protein [Corynebacterium parakroppenstedtii]
MRPSTRQHLINNIPAPRFQTYLDAAQQDPDKAFALYQWNIEVAAAVTSTLAIVEIALRDTIDQQLRKWNTIEGGELINGLPNRECPLLILFVQPRPQGGQTLENAEQESCTGTGGKPEL